MSTPRQMKFTRITRTKRRSTRSFPSERSRPRLVAFLQVGPSLEAFRELRLLRLVAGRGDLRGHLGALPFVADGRALGLGVFIVGIYLCVFFGSRRGHFVNVLLFP